MYEDYTRQALPSKEYSELLGNALVVFNSNNAFIIENILNSDDNNLYTWHELIDYTSGELTSPIKRTITKNSNTNITNLFSDLIQKRNRIVHSFQITNPDGEQILATKDRDHKQFHVTKNYLLEFIKKNEELSILLHDYRGY